MAKAAKAAFFIRPKKMSKHLTNEEVMAFNRKRKKQDASKKTASSKQAIKKQDNAEKAE